MLEKYSKHLVVFSIGCIVLLLIMGVLGKLYNQIKDYFRSFGSNIDSETAKTMAESLHVAMSGIGTDEVIIQEILLNLTKADYYKVSLQFGMKPYDSIFGTDAWFSFENANLTEWLIMELTPFEIGELKTQNVAMFEIFS